MSQINVDSIANTNEDGPVYFPYGMRGDASNLIYEPKVLYFDPVPLSTGISTTTNITVTFDQQIQFSGVGTIYIREGSATGTILENFTCGVDPGASIAGETLVINPTSNLGLGTSYYVTLPSAGIANTFGAYYKGTEGYLFQTTNNIFSAEGGNYVFTVASAPSPTGYHKYHVFTSTGILTTYGPSVNSNDLTALLIAGGGGGGYAAPAPDPVGRGGAGGGAGGLIDGTGPTLNLPGGTWTITIGSGGAGSGSTPLFNSDPGNDSTISNPSGTFLTAYGGGRGGTSSSTPSYPGVSAYVGGPGGSGGGSTGGPTYPEGSGTPGQGFPGGEGLTPQPGQPYSPYGPFGGGGGGAGGAGANAYVSPSSQYGGNGGNGKPVSAFASPNLSGYVPEYTPIHLSLIGPTGQYAGGGGGGATAFTSSVSAGTGGPGGGGHGAWRPPTVSYPNAVTPEYVMMNGYSNMGGGGGGGSVGTLPTINPPTSSDPSRSGGAGGSGVFMIRYAVPAP